jgi:hypothetical protein
MTYTEIFRPANVDIDLNKIDSTVLRRLINEIRHDKDAGRNGPRMFDRIHNRHNRS